MVNPVITLGILAIGIIAFLNFGGVQRASAFLEGVKGKIGTGEVSVPQTQSGAGAVIIKAGSQAAVSEILSVKKSTAPVIERRKFGTGITTRERASAETLRKLTTFSGSGVAQFSDSSVSALSSEQLADIRRRTLTKTEEADVKALELRRTRAISRGIRPSLKLSGAELILRKREQEALSKMLLTSRFGGQTFIGGKLFAKAGFASGGLTPALRAERARAALPTIGKQGQVIENLGAGGSAILKARNEARVQAALQFNRRVIEAKKSGLPIPVFQGF